MSCKWENRTSTEHVVGRNWNPFNCLDKRYVYLYNKSKRFDFYFKTDKDFLKFKHRHRCTKLLNFRIRFRGSDTTQEFTEELTKIREREKCPRKSV